MVETVSQASLAVAYLSIAVCGWFVCKPKAAVVRGETERERSERRPREIEGSARTLADALPQIVWSTKPDGTIDYLSGRWFEFTGIDPKRGSAGWEASVHPADIGDLQRAWSAAVGAGSDFERCARYRAADGTYRWMLVRGVAVREAEGGAVRWFGTSTDIDAQKRSELALGFLADASALLASAPFSGVMATLDELVRRAVPEIAERCTVYVSGNDGTPTAITAPSGPTRDGRFDDVVANVCRTGEPVVRSASAQTEGAIVVPLSTGGEVLGAMAFIAPQAERSGGGAGLQLAEIVANRTATAIENARLFARERRTAKHSRYIADVGRQLSTSLDLQATLDEVCRAVVPELADVVVLNLLSADRTPYVAALSFADPALATLGDALRGQNYVRQLVPEAACRAFAEGRPQIVPDVDDAFLRGHIVDAHFAVARCISLGTSLVTLPLVSKATLLGSLSLYTARDVRERAYTEADTPFFQELAQRVALAIGNAQHFEREHRVADILQAASLPASLPNVPGLRFGSVYAPGKSEAHIGGDWYDAMRIADGRVVISIGDVAGSGLEAAVTMSNLRHILRGVAQIDPDPNTLLDAADKALRAEHDLMVTAFVGVLDPITLTLTYACAGHPPPYVRRPNGSIRQLPCTGVPLGLRERYEEPARTIEFERGSLLVLYTDGLSESTRDIADGERRIEAALGRSSVIGANDVARALHDAVLGTGAPIDDVAILTVEMPLVAPSSKQKQCVWRWTVGTDAESMRETRGALFRTLQTGGMLVRDCHTAELVFGELLGNVVRHAPGTAQVVLDWSGVAPVLNVLDRGAGFEYVARLPSDELSEHGRGLFLVSTLTEDFHVTKRRAGGSHARAVLAIGRGRS